LFFDAESYRVSSSKLESDRLFSRIGVPVPRSWPECGFPVVAKPSGGSGSAGVRLFRNQRQLEKFFPGSLPPGGWVLQEYMEGPSYSLEVVGVPGSYEALQVTDLEMDAGYDCKRVSAPTELSAERVAQFKEISPRIAEAVQLRGLMDVEVILHKDQLKVLEIDARLPSQTPTVVYQSTGCNILKQLPLPKVFASRHAAGPILHGQKVSNASDLISSLYREPQHGARRRQKGVIYEHIKVTPGLLEICGEHIMAEAGVLRLREDFYGADEAITNYVSGGDEWVATLIITGSDRAEAWEKRERVIGEIRKRFKLDTYKDPTAMMNEE
jgi:pyrrolysine biosynthesis protein PylC